MPTLLQLGNFIQQVGFPIVLSLYLLYVEHQYLSQMRASLAGILEQLRRLNPP